MSPKALHAFITLIVGLGFGIVWLKVFWNEVRRVPAIVLAAPVAVGAMGLGHWVAYDFSIGHWAADFSLFQAIFNTAVAAALLYRRSTEADRVTT